MPHAIIDKVAKITGLDKKEVEKRWEDAKNRAKDQYGDDEEKNWALITGIFKHSLGKEYNDKLDWVTKWKRNESIMSFNEFLNKNGI